VRKRELNVEKCCPFLFEPPSKNHTTASPSKKNNHRQSDNWEGVDLDLLFSKGIKISYPGEKKEKGFPPSQLAWPHKKKKLVL
jgi:hypothetical protein